MWHTAKCIKLIIIIAFIFSPPMSNLSCSRLWLQRNIHCFNRANHLSSHRRSGLVPLPKETYALGRLLFRPIWTRSEWRWDYASFFPGLNSSKSLLICTNMLGKMSHLKFFQWQYLVSSQELFQLLKLLFWYPCLIIQTCHAYNSTEQNGKELILMCIFSVRMWLVTRIRMF